jgi:hypothetical protein
LHRSDGRCAVLLVAHRVTDGQRQFFSPGVVEVCRHGWRYNPKANQENHQPKQHALI